MLKKLLYVVLVAGCAGLVVLSGPIQNAYADIRLLSAGADAGIVTTINCSTGLRCSRSGSVATFTAAGDGGGGQWIDVDAGIAYLGAGGTGKVGIGTLGPSAPLHVQATLPAAAVNQNGVFFDITSRTDAVSRDQTGLDINLNAGYTGPYSTQGMLALNSSAGTANSLSDNSANFGYRGQSQGVGAANVGTFGAAYNGTALNVGAYGQSFSTINNAVNVAMLGQALNTGVSATQIGGYFLLSGGAGTNPSNYTSAALLADNGGTTSPIFIARDNGTPVFTIADGATITATGSITAANLTGTNSGNVTIGTANGLSISTQVLSLATAVAGGANGALLGTDKSKLDVTSGTNSGDLTLVAVGTTPSTAGASLSGQALTLQPADATHGGVISTTTQSIAGNKTLTGSLTSTLASGNSLVIDTTTLVADATNHRVGIGTASPSSFLHAVNTLPTDTGATQNGVNFNFASSSGSTGRAQTALNLNLSSGYTGGFSTQTMLALSTTASTANSLSNNNANFGFRGQSQGVGAANVGAFGAAYNASSLNVGVYGQSFSVVNNATNVGVLGQGLNTGTSAIQIGGYFILSGGAGTDPGNFTSTALLADNGGTTSNIFVAKDNGTAVFTIADGAAITATGAMSITKNSGNTLIVNTSDLVVDSTNHRVGVKNASPAVGLDVISAQADAVAYLKNTDTTGSSAMKFFDSSAVLQGSIGYGNSGMASPFTSKMLVHSVGALDFLSGGSTLAGSFDTSQRLVLEKAVRVKPTTLETCAAGIEWQMRADAASGVSTGHRSRVCLCTSDGAGSPAYAWENITSGTIGTTTTCPD